MQCLTLKENFIFTCQVKFRSDRKNSELGDYMDSIMLVTIKAIYVFEPNTKRSDQNKSDNYLEKKLIMKCLHDEVYVEKFSNEFNEITYKSINEDSDLKFVIKLESTQAKEYVKILALFEGWKLAVKSVKEAREPFNLKDVGNTDFEYEESKKNRRNTKSYIMSDNYPNIIYLFQIIDSFIMHDYVFQIDYLIMQLHKEYPYFLRNFFFVITIFNKIKIDLLLDDQMADVFPAILPIEDDVLKDNILNFNVKYALIHLSLKDSNLKDSFAERILPPFLLKSPFLQVLDLSYNFLTNSIFLVLLTKDHINIHLKTLNLSYNKLTSDNLSKYIFQISKEFLCITLFDLRGNKIDNRFLNNFNPKLYEELRNIIQDKLSGNNPNNYSKEQVIFDLRDTNINIEKTSYRLYLKKKKDLSGHLEIKNSFNDNYEGKFFGLENINFIFDVYFFNRNNYKYTGCSKSKSKLNVDVKCFQLRLPSNIKEKKIIPNEPANNWFKTNFYEKEIENEMNDEKDQERTYSRDTKIKRNAVANINDSKKNKTKSITEEEENKNKSSFFHGRSSVSYSTSKMDSNFMSSNTSKERRSFDPKSSKGKESRSSISKYTKEIDSRFMGQSGTIIEEDDSDSFSGSSYSEESEKKNTDEMMDRLYSQKSSSNNRKSKGTSSITQTNNNQISNANNTNNIENSTSNVNNRSSVTPSNRNELSKTENEEKPNNNTVAESNRDSVINNEANNDQNNVNNDYMDEYRNNNETIIIEGTDDDSSEEEKKKPIFAAPRRRSIKESVISRNQTKSFIQSKNTLFDKNVDYNKLNQFKKQHELDLYRELFKFFFLLDYYFDPILNSFATEMPQGIERDKAYMSIKNEEKRYEALKNSINYSNNKKKNKKHKYQENENMTDEMYQNEAKQMYYDYLNMLNIKKNEKKITSQNLLSFLFKNILKNSIDMFKANKKFNPNGLIEHMSFFYLFLASPHDYKIKIPFTTLNKLISRIKLESLLCLKEKSHNSLGTLSKITAGLNLSVQAQVNSVFIQLTDKAKLILRGLAKVLNFEGYNRTNNVIGFLFETGNFLDIFLEKAESIFLDNDLVIICKYIQYWRDNYLRNIIYNLMREIGKKEGTTRACDMTEEFAKANEDYKNVPIKNMGINKDINYPEFAQHPSNVDYLYLSEKSSVDFEKDLKNISRYIKADQTYFKRNLYDRINFLFCNTSRNRKNKTNTYSLHKGNIYLKIMRILFRYNNNLDYIEFEKRKKNANQEYLNESSKNTSNMNASSIVNGKIFNQMVFKKDNVSNNKSLINENYEFDIAESLDKVAIEEKYLREIDFPEEDNMETSERIKRDKKKIRLLLHSNNYNEPETLLDLNDLNKDKKIKSDQIGLFIETTRNFKSKCQEKLVNLEEMTRSNFISIVQNYIRYFLVIKEKFKKSEGKLWEYLNLECFYQLYRFANVDNFSYKKGKNEIDYPFIFLYIMCFYFEFTIPMKTRVKGFAYYLFSHLNHRKHCKGIIRALNNPFRYNWVMSTYEMCCKIDCKPLTLSLFYPSNDGSFKEDFIINETSTSSTLMKDVLDKSIILKDSKEKGFYWVYFTTNEQPWRYQYINYEQVLVELIAVQEESERDEESNNLDNRTGTISNINDNRRYSSVSALKFNDIDNNDENSDDKNEKEDNILEAKTFRKMHFEIKRRIFTPNLLKGNIEYYNYYEKELLFNQIKNIFYSSEIVDYTWSGIGGEIAMACYFESLAEKKRQALIKQENELESRISSSRVYTKFDLNMKDMELLSLSDTIHLKTNTNNDSFTTEHNLTSYNRDNKSFGLKNSTSSSKNNKTFKTYAYNFHDVNTYNSNMDVIKEEDDDENNNNINDNSNKVPNEDLDIEVLFPKNFDLKDQPLKQIYNEIGNKIHKLSDPKDIFFDLVKERPILMSNIFEVNIKQSNESFPEKFLLSINLEKVEFLYRTNYKKFFEFKYDEIVKCLILDDFVLLLVLNVFKDEIDQRSEIILRIESNDNRFIMEDILSYSQLYLAIKTKSQYVHLEDDLVSFLKGYKLMFDRPLPFRLPPAESAEEKNQKEIGKMRELLHNNDLYKKYKEEKAKKEEAEIIASKKGKLDIKSITNIPRYNNFDDESDSEESSESVKVVGLKLNTEENKTEIHEPQEKKEEENNDGVRTYNKELTRKEEEKIEIEPPEPEKPPEKTEEEKKQELEYQKKLKENEEKRQKADLALSKALKDFDFDDDDEEKEEEEEF